MVKTFCVNVQLFTREAEELERQVEADTALLERLQLEKRIKMNDIKETKVKLEREIKIKPTKEAEMKMQKKKKRLKEANPKKTLAEAEIESNEDRSESWTYSEVD